MTDRELPEEVTGAIHAGRRIEAIKLLRRHWNLDLKAAKEHVDAYAAVHPDLVAEQPSRPSSGTVRLVIVSVILVALYLVHRAMQ